MLNITPQTTTPALLSTSACSNKRWNETLDRLRRSKNFQVHGDAITNAAGITISAVARWTESICLDDGFTQRRFRILDVQYLHRHLRYAVPTELVDKCPALPELPLSKAELTVLYQSAEVLTRTKDLEDRLVHITPVERTDVKAGRDIASRLPQNAEALASILQSSPWVLDAMCATLLANLRAWMKPVDAPKFICNFVLPPKESARAHDALVNVLNAGNFTCNPDAPWLIQVAASDAGDLQPWHQAGRRLVLLNCRGKALQKLLRQAEQCVADAACHQPVTPFSALPVVSSRKRLAAHIVHNCAIPEGVQPLSLVELDALRRTMSQLLQHPKKQAQQLIELHNQALALPQSYRTNLIEVWLGAMRRLIVQSCQPLEESVRASAQALAAEEAASEDRVAAAVAFILKRSNYERWIDDTWPTTTKETKTMLETDGEAMALEHTIAGKRCLFFTTESLERLGVLAGLQPCEFNLFKGRLVTLGVIDKETEHTNFTKGVEFRTFRISCENL